MVTYDDLISGKALINELYWLVDNVSTSSKDEVYDMIDRVERQPTIDAKPAVHGKWELSNMGYLRCSKCHGVYVGPDWISDAKWSYCPNCGAKMDGGLE